MKKLFALVLVSMILASAAALADVDLSDLSYTDLLALRDQVQAELISRPEWKQVTVPGGTWTVGEDIPAGSYSIYPVKSVVIHLWGAAVDDFDTAGGMLISDYWSSPTTGLGKVALVDGNVLQLSAPVIFAPAEQLHF